MRRLFLLVQGHDGIGDVIHGHDVNLVAGAQRQHRQPGEEDKGLHHVELCGLGTTAIAQHNAGAEDGARHVRQQFADHVLAEFLGARVRVVVRAVPIDSRVLGDHLVFAHPGHGHCADVTEAAQAVRAVRPEGQLDNLERAAQVDVQTTLFRLAVQRRGTVND